jgi:hypothetical protein
MGNLQPPGARLPFMNVAPHLGVRASMVVGGGMFRNRVVNVGLRESDGRTSLLTKSVWLN